MTTAATDTGPPGGELSPAERLAIALGTATTEEPLTDRDDDTTDVG